MQKVRVANPGPAGLLVINPRGRKMATRKRRTARPAARRKPTTPRKRRTNPTVFSSSRKRVTRRRRSVARRRNPSTGGLLHDALGLGGGALATNVLVSMLPPIGGASAFAVAGRQAAVGWGLGELMRRFGIMPGYANLVKLSGATAAVVTIANNYLMPTISGFLRPAPRQSSDSNGVGDLVTLPAGNYDPYYGSTPKIGGVPVRANKAAQLKDLLAMPAMPGAYQRYGR